MKKINPEYIDKLYYYDKEDLGYKFINNINIFKVWSPLAELVKLCIYDTSTSKESRKYNMTKAENGVFEIKINENLEGKYYTFLATIDNNEVEAVDPYAKAVSVNGEKGAIINLRNTNPQGWNNHKRPKIDNPTDAVIYEVHTRDLSIDGNSGIKSKGKFLGFAEEDTLGCDYIKTGLAHIKELGVTSIQLLPIYDFSSIDEKSCNLEGEYENSLPYNWGYDPANYNVPEGSYSTNPYDPVSRIKELKIAIKAIHENGLTVIMDVVYNHMYDVEKSGFNKLMPGYFFRYDENMNLIDESGCGNAIASENAMVRKFIVDSVKYWAREYKLDGFRFDLMGLLDIKTMKEIREELDKIDPSIITLGEGWNMGTTLSDSEKAIQPNANKLKGIAFFNDDIRDGLRGSGFDTSIKGFLNSQNNMELRVKKGIVGGINYSEEINTWGEVEPNQVVNYIECHDNHTLFDKLNLDIKDELRIKYASRLGASIVLLSQGIPFIHAGQEFLRTKQGVENSYNSNDSINKIDWNRKASNLDTVEYYKGLIALRKRYTCFRMRKAEDIKKNIEFIDSPENSVAYILKNRGMDEGFKEMLVIHNANESTIKVKTNLEAKWNVLVNKDISGTNVIETVYNCEFEVPGLSTIVACS